jgi:S-adenosylmethionine:tRNA ribosyltransferase-isomerase
VIAQATDCFVAHELRDVAPVERDDVALLVSRKSDGALINACFDEVGDFLEAGDVLVVNTSATLPAALPATVRGDAAGGGAGDAMGHGVDLHLSTPVSATDWVVELRNRDRTPWGKPRVGTVLELRGGGTAEIVAPYLGSRRLAVARLTVGMPVEQYLAGHGHPIRYRHSPDDLGIEAYQTVFARDPGSAEMPSAARPFSAELVAHLVAGGVQFAPITLHCGVSSLEAGEAPYPERYRVSSETARLVNAARWQGGRIIAVGTTAVRALETVADEDGIVAAGAGFTNLVVTPERGVRAVDGLLTGWHEPESSHLQLLEAVAGPVLLSRSYAAAAAAGYRFHEFGDSNLILR